MPSRFTVETGESRRALYKDLLDTRSDEEKAGGRHGLGRPYGLNQVPLDVFDFLGGALSGAVQDYLQTHGPLADRKNVYENVRPEMRKNIGDAISMFALPGEKAKVAEEVGVDLAKTAEEMVLHQAHFTPLAASLPSGTGNVFIEINGPQSFFKTVENKGHNFPTIGRRVSLGLDTSKASGSTAVFEIDPNAVGGKWAAVWGQQPHFQMTSHSPGSIVGMHLGPNFDPARFDKMRLDPEMAGYFDFDNMKAMSDGYHIPRRPKPLPKPAPPVKPAPPPKPPVTPPTPTKPPVTPAPPVTAPPISTANKSGWSPTSIAANEITDLMRRGPPNTLTEDALYNYIMGTVPGHVERNNLKLLVKGKTPYEVMPQLIEHYYKGTPYERLARRIQTLLEQQKKAGLVSRTIDIAPQANAFGALTRSRISKAEGKGPGLLQQQKHHLELAVGEHNINPYTILHEMTHHVTVHQIDLAKNAPAGSQLHEAYTELDKLFDHVQKHKNINLNTPSAFEHQMPDQGFFKNIHELVAWGLTDPATQRYLESIPYKSSNAWTALVEGVRKLLGLSPQEETAFSALLNSSEKMMDVPFPEVVDAYKNAGMPFRDLRP